MKFCGICGKQLEDEALVCPYCGMRVGDEQETSQLNVEGQTPTAQTPPGIHVETVDANAFFKKAGATAQTAVQAAATTTQTIATNAVSEVKSLDSEKKKKIIIIAAAALAALVILGVTIGIVVNSSKYIKIDMKQLFTIETTGLNGKGSVYGKENEEYLIEKIGKAVGLDSEDEDFEDFSMDDLEELLSPEQIKKMKAITKAWGSMEREDIEKNGQLSNGEEITITYKYDKDLMKKAYIKIQNPEFKYKIEGLNEGQKIDVFEGLKLVYSGVSPSLSVKIDKSGCNQFVQQNVTFSVDKSNNVKKGDKITVSASYSQSTLEKNAYIIDEDKREFTVSGGAEYISSLEGHDLTAIEKEMNDKLNAYISTRSSIKSGSLKSKHFLKIKDQYSDNYSSNNRLVFLYEYQTDSSYSPTTAIGVYVDDLIKSEDGSLKWNYDIKVTTEDTLDKLTNSLVNSKVDKYVATQVQ